MDDASKATEAKKIPIKLMLPIITVLISAAGNVLSSYIAAATGGNPKTKFDDLIVWMKNNQFFHWILFIGICIISIGAVLDASVKIWGVVSPLFVWIASFKN